MPTATEDAKKMGYQSSNTTTSTTSTSSTSSNPLNPNNVTYRDALASGMWRVRTAPFVFYIGDSAYTVRILFSVLFLSKLFTYFINFLYLCYYYELDGSNISSG